MEKKRTIIFIILGAVPVLFLLFVLATIHILLLFLVLILLLTGLNVLKIKMPQLFDFRKRETASEPVPTGRNAEPRTPKPQVYMVLSVLEDYDARRIMVNKPVFTIGRGTDNDYVIDSGRISRHHLRIEYDSMENVCYAVDVGSANGTYLNSKRMGEGERCRLIQGDRLMLDDRAYVAEYAHY